MPASFAPPPTRVGENTQGSYAPGAQHLLTAGREWVQGFSPELGQRLWFSFSIPHLPARTPWGSSFPPPPQGSCHLQSVAVNQLRKPTGNCLAHHVGHRDSRPRPAPTRHHPRELVSTLECPSPVCSHTWPGCPDLLQGRVTPPCSRQSNYAQRQGASPPHTASLVLRPPTCEGKLRCGRTQGPTLGQLPATSCLPVVPHREKGPRLVWLWGSAGPAPGIRACRGPQRGAGAVPRVPRSQDGAWRWLPASTSDLTSWHVGGSPVPGPV